jgi:hypothetical protein
VLRSGRFQVRINTDDHTPPHVHVVATTGVIIVELAVDGAPQTIRRVSKQMPVADRRAAFRLVAGHTAHLAAEWRRLHD